MKNKKNAPLGVADRTGRRNKSYQRFCVLRLLYRRGKENTMGKKLEYKIIWLEEPDPVKIKTTLCQLYARQNGLEFIGLEKVEKESKGA